MVATFIRTTVYRCYDESGQLLYVGKTTDYWPSREKNHRCTKHWWSQVIRVDFRDYKNVEAAEDAERAAITAEHPLYNVHGRSDDRLQWTRDNYHAAMRTWAVSPTAGKRAAHRIGLLSKEYRTRFGEEPPVYERVQTTAA